MTINDYLKKIKNSGKEKRKANSVDYDLTGPVESDNPELLQSEKSWLEKLNPFRRGTAPSVPKERSVTKEYNAGLISRLYFHWMTPLMAVSVQFCPVTLKHTNRCR